MPFEARAIRNARPAWRNRQERFDKIPQLIWKQRGLFTLPRRRRSNFGGFVTRSKYLKKWSLATVRTAHRDSGRTLGTSWSRNAVGFMNTAKCPPSIVTNVFVGARIESTNERARLVGVVKSSAP